MSSLLWNAWLKKQQTYKSVTSDYKEFVERALNVVDHDGDSFTARISWHSTDN
jgi:hypothetical protein